MKHFIYKIYLRLQVSLLAFRYFLKKSKKFFFFFFYFSQECRQSFSNFFKGLSRSYKFTLLFLLTILFFGTTLSIAKVYSQDFSTSTNTTGTSSIPANAVQDEFIQMVNLTDSIVQGTTTSTSQGQQSHQLGLLDVIANVETNVYTNNPVSLVQYGKYYAQTHGIIKGAFAQNVTGSGYVALSPVIPLWELFRNIAYLIILVMIVVIGFIIIFGGKYGQSEITIISSLPKVILALVLITFSYPLAGFAVDIANLGTNIVVNVLGPRFVTPGDFYPGQYPAQCSIPTAITNVNTGGSDSQTVPSCDYANNVTNTLGGDFNIFHLMAPITNYGAWGGSGTGKPDITKLVQAPTNIRFLDVFIKGISFLGNTAEFAIDFILNVLILFWAIKIFILILTSYVRIVIAAMFSPFMLISYPLSGGSTFWSWIKGLLSPALVFPAVFAMMFIAAILAYGTDCSGSTPCTTLSSETYGPWYINQNNGITNFSAGPALFVDTIQPQFMWNFIALGIIIAIPAIGKHLDEIFGNQVNRHIAAEGDAASKRAAKIASQIPFVGSILGKVV